MENSIAVLAETFGAETVLSAVVVCVVMMLIRKFKPELSPKAEVGVRFIISLLVHLIFILISQGEILGLAQGATSVCGVSMIVCTLISKKGGKEKVKEEISQLLPQLDEQKLNAVLGESENLAREIPVEITTEEISQICDRPTAME